MISRADARLVYVLSLGISGVVILFSFVVHVSVLEAVITSAIAVAIALSIAIFGLPPWQGTARGRTLVLGFGVIQLVLVIAITLLIKS